MRIFINGLAASAGGGLTYFRNVLPHLAACTELHVVILLSSGFRQEFPDYKNVEFMEAEASATRRFWFEQTELPKMIRSCRSDVLLSAGNFAIRRSGIPQILLSRNSLYTSADFFHDLRRRKEYRMWADTKFRAVLARRSIGWANITVAPSESFAAELRLWTGKNIQTIYHGFDRDTFFNDSTPFAPEIQEKLRTPADSVRLLFVSHYNYYRNFETLIRALPQLRERLHPRPVRLYLTCKLQAGENPGAYDPRSAAGLISRLGVEENVVQLGSIPYRQLHHLYASCGIYVSPAYAETFAHPLVEAMASGLPVVASDLAVHREICQDAALYFGRFSSEELAERVARIVERPEVLADLKRAASRRAGVFSWEKHVRELLSVADGLASGPN